MPRRQPAPRFPGFDYRQPGAYFVTFCTWRRRRILGRVVDGVVRVSAIGALVETVWASIPRHHPGVLLDTFVVMPDHVHGILVFESPVRSLTEIVSLFKAASTREINRMCQSPGRVVWQRSFYERIIRDHAEWARIRTYIADNPRNWRG
jgi:REP element-mobilizing transposase RayT